MSGWQVVVPERDGLGESPFWHPHERALYWIDIPGRRLRRWFSATGALESWEMPQDPGCIAPAASGGLVIALRDGIYRARGWGELLTPIVRFSHDPKTTRFNDGKCDSLGRFWAGTLYEPKDARRAELYCIDCRPGNGQGGKPLVQLKAHNAITANGLAWSPRNDATYWADTAHHIVHAWDWEPQGNALRHHRVFQQFPPKPSGWKPGQPGYGGRPDGAAVDSAGNYWIAMFEGQRLLKLSPAGELLAELPVPVRCPTMPCFGGDDLKTLYVTSGGTQRGEAELNELPASGCIIATQVDVPGLPVNFFID